MTLDEVIKKSTIRFPKGLSLEHAENLLKYIAHQLPGRINFTSSYSKTFDKKEDYIGEVKLHANIVKYDKNFNLDSLNFQVGEDFLSFSGFQFQLIPGYDDLRDYRDKLCLWNQIRKIVSDYLSL